MVYKCCIVNCCSDYTGKESTTVFSFPKEEDLKKRWIKSLIKKIESSFLGHIHYQTF